MALLRRLNENPSTIAPILGKPEKPVEAFVNRELSSRVEARLDPQGYYEGITLSEELLKQRIKELAYASKFEANQMADSYAYAHAKADLKLGDNVFLNERTLDELDSPNNPIIEANKKKFWDSLSPNEKADLEFHPSSAIKAMAEYEVGGKKYLGLKLDIGEFLKEKEPGKLDNLGVEGFGVNLDIDTFTLSEIYKKVHGLDDLEGEILESKLKKFVLEHPDVLFREVQTDKSIHKTLLEHGWTGQSDEWRHGETLPLIEYYGQNAVDADGKQRKRAVIAMDNHSWGLSKLNPLAKRQLEEETVKFINNEDVAKLDQTIPGLVYHSALVQYEMLFKDLCGPSLIVNHSTGERAIRILLGMLSAEQTHNMTLVNVAGAESDNNEHTTLQQGLIKALKLSLVNRVESVYDKPKGISKRIQVGLARVLGKTGAVGKEVGKAAPIEEFLSGVITTGLAANKTETNKGNSNKNDGSPRHLKEIHGTELKSDQLLATMQAYAWSSKSIPNRSVTLESGQRLSLDALLTEENYLDYQIGILDQLESVEIIYNHVIDGLSSTDSHLSIKLFEGINQSVGNQNLQKQIATFVGYLKSEFRSLNSKTGDEYVSNEELQEHIVGLITSELQSLYEVAEFIPGYKDIDPSTKNVSINNELARSRVDKKLNSIKEQKERYFKILLAKSSMLKGENDNRLNIPVSSNPKDPKVGDLAQVIYLIPKDDRLVDQASHLRCLGDELFGHVVELPGGHSQHMLGLLENSDSRLLFKDFFERDFEELEHGRVINQQDVNENDVEYGKDIALEFFLGGIFVGDQLRNETFAREIMQNRRYTKETLERIGLSPKQIDQLLNLTNNKLKQVVSI